MACHTHKYIKLAPAAHWVQLSCRCLLQGKAPSASGSQRPPDTRRTPERAACRSQGSRHGRGAGHNMNPAAAVAAATTTTFAQPGCRHDTAHTGKDIHERVHAHCSSAAHQHICNGCQRQQASQWVLKCPPTSGQQYPGVSVYMGFNKGHPTCRCWCDALQGPRAPQPDSGRTRQPDNHTGCQAR